VGEKQFLTLIDSISIQIFPQYAYKGREWASCFGATDVVKHKLMYNKMWR